MVGSGVEGLAPGREERRDERAERPSGRRPAPMPTVRARMLESRRSHAAPVPGAGPADGVAVEKGDGGAAGEYSGGRRAPRRGAYDPEPFECGRSSSK